MLATTSSLRRAAARSPLSSIARAAPCTVQTRSKVGLAPSVVFEHRNKERVYDERKTYLYNQYTRLFTQSTECPALFFAHADFSIQRLIKLRGEINAAALRYATPATPSLAKTGPAPEPPMPQFTILRTSIFGVALRDHADIDHHTAKTLAKMVTGTLAVLTLPNLNPPQLNAILRAVARSVPPRVPKTQKELDDEKKAEAAAFVPGRRPKRHRPVAIPDLKLYGALIEGRLLTAPGVEDVAKLPTLDTLRAQLVGLLSAPSAQLAAVLSQAGGAKLARTLEGLKKSLEEGESTPVDAP